MDFLNKLKEGSKLKVCGNTYEVLAMNYFISQDDTTNWYAKIALKNKFAIVCDPQNHETLDFGFEINQIASGENFPETIYYDGKTFEFESSGYQIVKEIKIGNPLNIEGECLFTNHRCTTNNNESISMGYIPRTKTRADIFLKTISFDDVSII